MLAETGLVSEKHKASTETIRPLTLTRISIWKASLDYITSMINNKLRITPYISLGAALQKSV